MPRKASAAPVSDLPRKHDTEKAPGGTLRPAPEVFDPAAFRAAFASGMADLCAADPAPDARAIRALAVLHLAEARRLIAVADAIARA